MAAVMKVSSVTKSFRRDVPVLKNIDLSFHAGELVARAGGRVLNLDITLICERPRIGPHRDAMRARTAEILGLEPARVSVKATTMEGLGALGRGEGIAAQAIVTVAIGPAP